MPGAGCRRPTWRPLLPVLLTAVALAVTGCGDSDADEFAEAKAAEKQAALNPPPPPQPGEIDLAGMLALRPPTTGPALIDARGTDVWKAGHIPGALDGSLDRAALQAKLGSSKRVVIIYGDGPTDARVADAEARVHDAGYPSTKRFPGGMEAWMGVHARTEAAP